MMNGRRAIAALCVCAGLTGGLMLGAAPAGAATHSEFIFVGNNWEGTADVLRFTEPVDDAPATGLPAVGAADKPKSNRRCKKKKRKALRKRCKRKKRRDAKKGRMAEVRGPGDVQLQHVGRVNIIPDADERYAEMLLNPARLAYFFVIRLLIGEGHDQFVDDMYTAPDGKLLVVSRPSFADVVGIDLTTGEVVWRFVVDGQRSDHMAVSPDGTEVAVSASTGNVVHILDIQTGEEKRRFDSGDSPHENTYSADGKRIYHASIGLVYTPLDDPTLDTTKGERFFQVVDTETNEIISRVDMGEKLAEAGYPDMSSAVRPMAITNDERYAYLQVSFFHGYVEYDLQNEKVTRVVDLPNLVPDLPKELYLLDSAHHGIALDGTDSTLCVAGTMSDYVAMVDPADPADKTVLRIGEKPYWATTSDTGKYCYVSWSGSDFISVVSYENRTEVARIPVGDHPQRIRTGALSPAALAAIDGTAPSPSAP